MGFWPLYGTFCSHLLDLPSCFARRRYVTFKGSREQSPSGFAKDVAKDTIRALCASPTSGQCYNDILLCSASLSNPRAHPPASAPASSA